MNKAIGLEKNMSSRKQKGTKPKGLTRGEAHKLRQVERGPAPRVPPRLRLLPPKQERKKAKAYKAAKNVSIEEAYARCSSLPPSRLALKVNANRVITWLTNIATLMSYHIQSHGSAPCLDVTTEASGWNPSTVYAYLISIFVGRMLTIGALQTSTQIQVMQSYNVPTFFAKWLQQISPAHHMGREIVPTCDATADTLLGTLCGTGGISNIVLQNGGWCEAPVWAQTPGDSEGWYTNVGNGTNIYPISTTPETYSKISSVIAKTFKHHVKVSEIPLKASNAELKCTPVTDSEYGQFMYSVVDANLTCDLLLPLCSLYDNDLVNSTNSTLIPNPVRIDSGLCISPEAKLAFMFELANKYPFKGKDSFVKYLRKFGFKDYELPNIIVNLRQINWAGVFNQCVEYCQTMALYDANGFWYLFNYCMTILNSNIPGAFRAISPVARDWTIAPLFKGMNNQPQYAGIVKNPKMPPFLAVLVKSLREPIRYENQVSFYVSVLPPVNAGFWWDMAAVATQPLFYNQGGYTYGEYPSTIFSTKIRLTPGSGGMPFIPYPGFTKNNSSYVDAMRNYVVQKGTGSATGYFQAKSVQVSSNLNVYNTWLSKPTHFTRRHAKFYIISYEDGNVILSFPSANSPSRAENAGLTAYEIFSNEPSTHHTAVLALAHMMGYFSPSDKNVPMLGPCFSAQPLNGTETVSPAAHAGEQPAQGTSNMVKVAESPNPQEVVGHLGAEAASDVIPDASEKPHPDIIHKVSSKLEEKVKTGVDEVATAAGDLLGSTLNKLI